MNANAGFERLLESWLESETRTAPEHVHSELIERAQTARQRPAWVAALHSTQPAAIHPGARGRSLAFGIVMTALLIFLALVVAAVGTRKGPPPPFGPAANGSFLYGRDGDIYLADGPGVLEVALVTGPTHDTDPLWSHDGTKFAFLRVLTSGNPILMAADVDGSRVRQLSPGALDSPDWFDWSPSGTEIAVHHLVDLRGAISILSDGGAPMRTLELGPVEPWGFVAWRPPTGSELILVGHPGPIQTELAVFGVRPDGRAIRPISVKRNELAGRPGSVPNPLQYSFQNMVLSDDGSRAAFWNWEPTVEAGRPMSVHVLDLDSGKDRRMVYDPASNGEMGPVLSPDGTLVAFETGYPSTPNDSQILVAPVNGGKTVRVGPSFPGRIRHGFTFSPDGSAVLLFIEGDPTRLVPVSTGEVQEISSILPAIPSWQRRSP